MSPAHCNLHLHLLINSLDHYQLIHDRDADDDLAHNNCADSYRFYLDRNLSYYYFGHNHIQHQNRHIDYDHHIHDNNLKQDNLDKHRHFNNEDDNESPVRLRRRVSQLGAQLVVHQEAVVLRSRRSRMSYHDHPALRLRGRLRQMGEHLVA